MPLFDPEESLQALIDLSGAREQIESQAQQLYPSDPLNMDERQRLQSLTQRSRRLQPAQMLQFGQFGSSGGGNPFAVDTRGAAQGIGNLALGVVNRIRENRRGEFEGELSGLQQRQLQDQQAQESRREFTRERTEALLDEQLRTGRELAVESARQTGRLARDAAQHEQELEQIAAREEERRKTAEFAQQLKNDPNNRNARNVVYQEARDIIESQFPQAKTLERRIDRLTTQRNALARMPGRRGQAQLAQIDEELAALEAEFEDVSHQIARAWLQFNPALSNAFTLNELQDHARQAMSDDDQSDSPVDVSDLF